MARIITVGWESGVPADEVDGYTTTLPSIITATPTPRTGGYCARFGNTGTRWLLDTSVYEYYVGFGFYIAGGSSGNITFSSPTVNQPHLVVDFNANTQSIKATNRGNDYIGSAGFPTSEWNYIEIHFKLDGSTGVIEVKLNGDMIIQQTGITTTTVGWTNTIQNMSINVGNNNTMYMDDMVVNTPATSYNNTWPGRVRLIPLRPNAAGDVTQLSRGGTDSGANWSQVEEAPASATDWVWSDVADRYDLYNFGTTVLPTGYAIPNIIVVNDSYLDSGSGKITSKIKSDGTEAQGSDHTLSNTAHCYTDAFPYNPNTSGAWDQTDVDNIQAGPMVRAA